MFGDAERVLAGSESHARVDCAGAGMAYLDSRFTISTNLGHIVAQRDRRGLMHGKRWVHSRVAHHIAKLAREVGFSWIEGVVIEARVTSWLNSFER